MTNNRIKPYIAAIICTIFLFFLAVHTSDTEKSVDETTDYSLTPVKTVSAEQVRCLATGIYYEAGQEPTVGKIAVARVIVNRVAHGFGSTPCKVVYQTTEVNEKKMCQFSWACDDELKSKLNLQRYLQAEKIARDVLSTNAYSDLIPDNVLYFHNTSVNPHWKLQKYSTIGNHVFYSQGREKRSSITLDNNIKM
jgi:spore germination cell wall hydrolase CwlJ-like protein